MGFTDFEGMSRDERRAVRERTARSARFWNNVGRIRVAVLIIGNVVGWAIVLFRD